MREGYKLLVELFCRGRGGGAWGFGVWLGWVVLRLAMYLLLGATSSTFVYENF